MGGSSRLHRWDMATWCLVSMAFIFSQSGSSWPQLASGGLSWPLSGVRSTSSTSSNHFRSNPHEPWAVCAAQGEAPHGPCANCMKSLSMGGGGQRTISILHVCMRLHLSHNFHILGPSSGRSSNAGRQVQNQSRQKPVSNWPSATPSHLT